MASTHNMHEEERVLLASVTTLSQDSRTGRQRSIMHLHFALDTLHVHSLAQANAERGPAMHASTSDAITPQFGGPIEAFSPAFLPRSST
jgi:hypothetical protein